MRYSTFAASLLISTAAAWRLPDYTWANQGWRPTSTSTSASVTPSATQTSAAPATTASAAASVTQAPSSATAAPSTPTGSSGSLTTDEQNALNAHNDARADVGTADLTWDASLAADALAYAKTLASSGTFQHSGVSDQGENLYMQSGSGTPLLNAVNAFLEEKKLYNDEAITSTNYMSFGHYSTYYRCQS